MSGGGDAVVLEGEPPGPLLIADHKDYICKFDGLAIECLTRECAFCRVTGEYGVTEPEVEHQICVPVAVDIFLMTLRCPGSFILMRLTRTFKGHGSVIHCCGIEGDISQDGYSNDPPFVVAVDGVGVGARLDVEDDQLERPLVTSHPAGPVRTSLGT